jgi:acyl-CoA thioesterase-2
VGTFDHLTLVRDGEAWVGRAPEHAEGVLFGGDVISQAIVAATRDAPEGRRLHSLHLYFLKPVVASSPVSYVLRPLRDGKSFSSRRVEASQGGKQVVDLTCSFTEDVDGYEYDLGGIPADVQPPDAYESWDGPPGWQGAGVGETERRPDGTYESTHRKWCKVGEPIGDDPHLHAALLGFATDWTGIGGRPLHLEGDTGGMVSLDHAIWFHRPARADAWHLYDVHSLVNAGGRGLTRGVLRDVEGRAVVSMAQEMRLTVIE